MFRTPMPMRALVAVSIFAATNVPLLSQEKQSNPAPRPALPVPEGEGGQAAKAFVDATVLLGVRVVQDVKNPADAYGRVLDIVFANKTGSVTHYVIGSTGGRTSAVEAAAFEWHDVEKVFTAKISKEELDALPIFDSTKLDDLVPANLRPKQKSVTEIDAADASDTKSKDGDKDGDKDSKVASAEAKAQPKPLPILATLSSVMAYEIVSKDETAMGRARVLILDVPQQRIAYLGLRSGQTLHYVPYGNASPAWSSAKRVELHLDVDKEAVAAMPQPSEENGYGIDDPTYRKCLAKYFAEAKGDTKKK